MAVALAKGVVTVGPERAGKAEKAAGKATEAWEGKRRHHLSTAFAEVRMVEVETSGAARVEEVAGEGTKEPAAKEGEMAAEVAKAGAVGLAR